MSGAVPLARCREGATAHARPMPWTDRFRLGRHGLATPTTLSYQPKNHSSVATRDGRKLRAKLPGTCTSASNYLVVTSGSISMLSGELGDTHLGESGESPDSPEGRAPIVTRLTWVRVG